MIKTYLLATSLHNPARLPVIVKTPLHPSERSAMSEKEKAIECIKALSKIEGYTLSYEGMKRTDVLYDSIDLIMKYFEDLLKELDK